MARAANRAPARVTAIETANGQAQVNAGGLWYKIVLAGGRVSLTFVDPPAKPKPPDGALPDGHIATGSPRHRPRLARRADRRATTTAFSATRSKPAPW